jgi:DNA-binding LacI/PurR family transcriptional regulator
MKDVANRASVSIGTVSRVVNDHLDVGTDLRERVQVAIQELGYRSDIRAQGLVRERSRIVGLVMCNGAEFSSVHAYLLVGIEEVCTEAGYYLLFARHRYDANIHPGELHLPGVIQARGLADCLIVTGTNYGNFLNALDDAGLTYVCLANHVAGHHSTGSARNQVRYSDSEGFEDATRYLIQLGHKQIWYIGDTSKPWFQQRYAGYAKAITENSLEPLAHTAVINDEPFQNGHAAVTFIMELCRPMTAIIGFQHKIDRSTANQLTCVCVDGVEVGRQLARAAIRRIESNRKDLSEVIVPTVLVKRGSCRPLRRGEHMVP